MPQQFTIQELVACVDREISMRLKVYPRWVRDKKMSQQKADNELAMMRAVRVELIIGHAIKDEALHGYAERADSRHMEADIAAVAATLPAAP